MNDMIATFSYSKIEIPSALHCYSFQSSRPECGSERFTNETAPVETSASPSNVSTNSFLDSDSDRSHKFASSNHFNSISPLYKQALLIHTSHDSGIGSTTCADTTSSPFCSTPLAFESIDVAFSADGNKRSHRLSQLVQYQSTPNKISPPMGPMSHENQLNTKAPLTTSVCEKRPTKRTNFHSIHELAESSSPCFTGRTVPISAFAGEHDQPIRALPEFGNRLGLKFNEQLQMICIAMHNKENISETSKNHRKPRTAISRQQRDILEYVFKLKSYPDSDEVEYLCNVLGFEENVIRIWFQNKRARSKIRRE